MRQITKFWILSGFWSVMIAAGESPLWLILLSRAVTVGALIVDWFGAEDKK